MARYGMDYGRWGRGERYDRGFRGRDRGFDPDEGYGGYGGGYGGMRSDGWGSDWQRFPGESGWFGDATPGYQGGRYDVGYAGAFRRGGFEDEEGGFGRGMYGGSYGGMGYGGRELGYGGFDYERGSYGHGWGMGSRRRSQRGQTRAAELMTENPECVTPETTLTEVARKMRELNVGIIPVVDNLEHRRLQGVITDRDITVRAMAEGKGGNTTVRECMTTDVETVNKNDPVEEVLQVMEQEQVRRVPVTDREGRLVGIIAQADLAVHFAGDDFARERRVEETIERISEPARPRRAAMAAQSRSSSTMGSASTMGEERAENPRGGRTESTDI
ncbi:MAG TPA: CBS domain-containing protein [Longimicrobiaceae bacterium]